MKSLLVATARSNSALRRPTFPVVVAALTLCITISGCAPGSSKPAPVSTADLIGKSLAVVKHDLGARVDPVYDLSKPIANIAATYNPAQSDANWKVVTACANSKTGKVAVGILPARYSNAASSAKARAGDYNKLLAECQ